LSSSSCNRLSAEEQLRYQKQVMLPEVGEAGQLRLKAARVLVVGVGGLGSPVALYLATAGIGTLGLVDDDVVDVSNLHRQILHRTPNVGQPKLVSARAAIAAANPDVTVETHACRLTADNALALLSAYDIVVDCSDNFPTRYLLNDACVHLQKPNVHGSVHRFEGQATLFDSGNGPCYRCLYPEPPPPDLAPSCSAGGVIGMLPGIIGMIQATEVVKWIIGTGRLLTGRLILCNALEMTFSDLAYDRDPDCPACGRAASPAALSPEHEIEPVALQHLLQAGVPVTLLDIREPVEYAFCGLPDAVQIPMATLPERMAGLDPAAHIVVICRSGCRSANVTQYLARHGFQHVQNLIGGLLRWAEQVDPAMPRY
jgi:sulfur-carrier protein adenylyltransferase/sulfurtransferase